MIDAMTPERARERTCPFMRGVSQTWAHNEGGRTENYPAKCEADGCMAWEWLRGEPNVGVCRLIAQDANSWRIVT